VAGLCFSLGTPVTSTNKTDCQNKTKMLLKVDLKPITLTLYISAIMWIRDYQGPIIIHLVEEEFEETKGVIRSIMSKYNGQIKVVCRSTDNTMAK
jgi:hypothetical protein